MTEELITAKFSIFRTYKNSIYEKEFRIHVLTWNIRARLLLWVVFILYFSSMHIYHWCLHIYLIEKLKVGIRIVEVAFCNNDAISKRPLQTISFYLSVQFIISIDNIVFYLFYPFYFSICWLQTLATYFDVRTEIIKTVVKK